MVRAALRSAIMANLNTSGNVAKLGAAERETFEMTRFTQVEDEENEESEAEFYANMSNKNKTRKKKKYMSYPKGNGILVSPQHVHAHDWKAMVVVSKLTSQTSCSSQTEHGAKPRSETASSELSKSSKISLFRHDVQSWIEQKFKRRECCAFIRSSKDPERCGCGRPQQVHDFYALSSSRAQSHGQKIDRWSINKHTIALPTDAYGTIEFLGNQRPYKAQYVRLDFASNPDDIFTLLEKLWQLEPPKLIISVHGGHKNFDLEPKLARIFRNGLINAAKSTSSWIITSGLDEGVVKYVSAALEPVIGTGKAKIVSIGIAPWGLVKRREVLIGKNTNVLYHSQTGSRYAGLNDKHSYYLLADNGTVGRYGADIILRRKLETFIMEQKRIPIVCVLLEGGTSSVKTVLEYTTIAPTVPVAVPVIVCDGSGRTSDLISYVHRNVDVDGELTGDVHEQLIDLIKEIFHYDDESADRMLHDILEVLTNKNMVNIFRMGKSSQQSLDHAILTALLKSHHLSASEQLMLTIAWNRVDIAKSDIFVPGREWPMDVLNDAMMEALKQNRVDFVRLLLEKGVNMKQFLSIDRLEQLYNTDKGPLNTLHFIVRDVVKIKRNYRYNLPHIGLVIEKLMGHGYRSRYASREFKEKYYSIKRVTKSTTTRLFSNGYTKSNGSVSVNPSSNDELATIKHAKSSSSLFKKLNYGTVIEVEDPESVDIDEFDYPYSDLFLWSVLTKRQDMAIFMWEHGEEALAKALIGTRLYKSLAKEAVEDYIESEICAELRDYSEQFHNRALELLDHCYRHDDDHTIQLLTYELYYWGYETCLSLAVICNSKAFLAHPICQNLLADLWHGGLKMRRHTNIKAIAGILCPPFIFGLEFKSKEELMLQAKTVSEHEHEINESSNEDSDSSSDSSEWDSSDEENLDNGRRESVISNQSNRHIFHNYRDRISSKTHAITDEIKRRASSVLSSASSSAIHKKNPSKKNASKHVAFVQEAKNESPKEDLRKAMSTPGNLAFALSKHKQINWRRKLYEFFQAPITTFWTWAMSYAIFMCILIYTLLVKTPRDPSGTEWYLFAYVSSCGLELLRRFIMSSSYKFKEKVHLFFGSFWNVLTTLAVFGYLLGFLFRILPDIKWIESRPKDTISLYDISLKTDVSRLCFAVDSVFWVLKMLDYLSIHPRFGPYVNVAGKMMLSSIYIIILLALALLSFGLPRQSILFPHEEWHWILLRNIFYKPYYMVYGEVYAAEIDLCDDDAWQRHLEYGIPLSQYNDTDATTTLNCPAGYWIPPILMTIFMIVTTFLLLSMLIATFNNIFDEANKIANQIWLFQRYNQVIQYECTPCLPPPLTPLYYIYMIYKYVKYKVKEKVDAKKKNLDNKKLHVHTLFELSLKLYLSKDQVEKLHDFEEECMDELSKAKEHAKSKSMEERIKKTAERSEATYVKLKEKETHDKSMLEVLDALERELGDRKRAENEILEQLQRISEELQLLRQNKPTTSSSEPLHVGLRPEIILPLPKSPRSPKSPTSPAPSRRRRLSTIIRTEEVVREDSYSALDDEVFESQTENEIDIDI